MFFFLMLKYLQIEMRLCAVFIMLAMMASMDALVQRTYTGTVHPATEVRASNHQMQAAGVLHSSVSCTVLQPAAKSYICKLVVSCLRWLGTRRHTAVAWHLHNTPLSFMAGLGTAAWAPGTAPSAG